MDIAEIIVDDFLYQNAFSKHDYTCPVAKSIGMLKTMITFYENAQKAIADSPAEKKLTWATIRTTMGSLLQKVIDGKFVDPKKSNSEIKEIYNQITKDIEDGFQSIHDV